MKKILVPFADTNQFSSLVDDYLSGEPQLRPFYRYAPEAGSFQNAIEQRANFPVNRKILVERLLAQYDGILDPATAAADKVTAAVKSLESDQCFTVTTGHQLNIFTGPLYAIYKIVTTIRLARELKTLHPACQFVPVFWMASEDHDFAEINNTRIYGKAVTWNREAGGAVGRMNPQGLQAVMEEVKEILGSESGCLELFESAYGTSPTLAIATRKIMHALFGEYGLVVIDGDDPVLKKEFVNEMRNDLLHHKSFDAVTETSKALSKFHKIQVQPRQINLFYLASGTRERIVRNDDGSYSVLNTKIHFSQDQLLEELETNPGNFSPNVVLRPLYQEKILPNLAYLGGPGELNYWLQFMKAFEVNEIAFPVLILRNCNQIIDKGSAAKLEKLGISVKEFFQSTDFLILKVLESSSTVHVGTESITTFIQKAFHDLGAGWSKLDPSLVSSVEAEKQKILNGLGGLEEKARRAMKRKNEAVVTQVKNLKEKLLPAGGLQERVENFLPYYCRQGNAFISDLVSNANPFEKHFAVLIEE